MTRSTPIVAEEATVEPEDEVRATDDLGADHAVCKHLGQDPDRLDNAGPTVSLRDPLNRRGEPEHLDIETT